jgi:hypothetical protein
MTDRALLAITHLRLRLLAINGGLRVAVAATAARNAKLDRPELARVCVTDRQVAVLLDQVDELAGPVISGDAVGPADVPGERELRQAAARAGQRLPLDELAARFELDRDAQDALLLVVAPEVDPGYERIFAYVLDDLGRRLPCVELLAGVGAGSAVERLLRRGWLGPTGTLRRCGLVLEVGDAPTDARQELRLATGLLDFLLGARLDLAAVARDSAGVELLRPGSAHPGVDPAELERVGDAVAAGSVGVVAVWCDGGHAEVVAALAARAGRTIRRLDVAELPGDAPAARMLVRSALRTAAATGAVLLTRNAKDFVGVPDLQFEAVS